MNLEQTEMPTDVAIFDGCLQTYYYLADMVYTHVRVYPVDGKPVFKVCLWVINRIAPEVVSGPFDSLDTAIVAVKLIGDPSDAEMEIIAKRA